MGNNYMELGQHIDLSQMMLEQALLADSTVYGFARRASVAFAKATDEMLLDAIIKKAKEHGITDLYVLNEDFILAAIQEKMDREKGCPYCRPDAEGYIQKFGAFSIHNGHLETGHCKPQKIKYCPHCGRPLTEEAWAELEKRLRG